MSNKGIITGLAYASIVMVLALIDIFILKGI